MSDAHGGGGQGTGSLTALIPAALFIAVMVVSLGVNLWAMFFGGG